MSCGSFYILDWALSDKTLLTSISDQDEINLNLSLWTYLINLTFQFVNTLLISFLIIGYNFFLYLGALVIIFRLKSISAVLNDLRYHQSEMTMRAKRMILIECQEMHVEVSA